MPNDLPIQRHVNCEEPGCSICLQDAEALAAYLHRETGSSPRTRDILHHYRTWLDRKGISAETEHGWPTANVFLPATIKAYLDSWKD